MHIQLSRIDRPVTHPPIVRQWTDEDGRNWTHLRRTFDGAEEAFATRTEPDGSVSMWDA